MTGIEQVRNEFSLLVRLGTCKVDFNVSTSTGGAQTIKFLAGAGAGAQKRYLMEPKAEAKFKFAPEPAWNVSGFDANYGVPEYDRKQKPRYNCITKRLKWPYLNILMDLPSLDFAKSCARQRDSLFMRFALQLGHVI